MTADGLAVGEERGDRLTKRPGELAVRARLALIDLRALGMHGKHRGFAGRGDGVWQRRLGARYRERARQQQQSERCTFETRHHGLRIPSLRGAKRRSNPDLLRRAMDCFFASLAMTLIGRRLTPPSPW